MKLGLDYVIYSTTLLVVLILPLYLYREKIFTFFYKTDGFNDFVRELKNYLRVKYPKKRFEFSIISKTAQEKDVRVRQSLVIENIISQLIEMPFERTTQDGLNKAKQWYMYDEKSINSLKAPNDWKQRREATWKRDERSCKRCSKPVKLSESATLFVTEIEMGGGYNLENLFTVCMDCNQIFKKDSSEIKFKVSNLDVYDDLYNLVDKF